MIGLVLGSVRTLHITTRLMHTFRPNPNFTRSSCSSLRVSVKGGLNEVLNVFSGFEPHGGVRVRVRRRRFRVRVRCFIVTRRHKGTLFQQQKEEAEERHLGCSREGGCMQPVMLGGDTNIATRVSTWIIKPRPTSVRTRLSDRDIAQAPLCV